MADYSDLHLTPAYGHALEALGWPPGHAAVRDAAATTGRGHNLVVVAPPAPVYAVPALAGALGRLGEGRRGLVLAGASELEEWGLLANTLGREAGLRAQVAHGTARAQRRLRAGEVDLLVTTAETALALVRRSALKAEELAAVVLGWPEGWPEGAEPLAAMMQDLPKDSQRLVFTAEPAAAAELGERYARKALTLGLPPAETAAPAPVGPVRTVSAPWGRRAAALADLIEVLDPASVAVWTADRSHDAVIERALPLGDPAIQLVTGDAPAADLIVAFDPPSRERLEQLRSAGDVVLVVPPSAESYMARIAAPRRPVRLPGLLEATTTAAASRRAAVVQAIEGGSAERGLLVLAPLFERYDPAAVAAAVYELWTTSSAAPAPLPDILASARVYVGAGKKDGVTANDLVAVLTKELRVDRTKIGRIELRDAFSLIELPAQEAESIATALNGQMIRRKRISARLDRGAARGGRPPRPERGEPSRPGPRPGGRPGTRPPRPSRGSADS